VTRLKGEKKFRTDFEVLDAFHYLARDVVKHPLVVEPKPMALNVLFTAGAVASFGWDNPDTAPWVELATYVRKLAILEDDSTNLTKVLVILGKSHEALRPEIKAVQVDVAEWRGSSKTQFLTPGADGSLSIRSNAEAAELVINGSLFHANADLLKIWRGLDDFAQSYCVASAQDWISTAGQLIKATSELIERACPEIALQTASSDGRHSD
jgi:hypothetical protein